MEKTITLPESTLHHILSVVSQLEKKIDDLINSKSKSNTDVVVKNHDLSYDPAIRSATKFKTPLPGPRKHDCLEWKELKLLEYLKTDWGKWLLLLSFRLYNAVNRCIEFSDSAVKKAGKALYKEFGHQKYLSKHAISNIFTNFYHLVEVFYRQEQDAEAAKLAAAEQKKQVVEKQAELYNQKAVRDLFRKAGLSYVLPKNGDTYVDQTEHQPRAPIPNEGGCGRHRPGSAELLTQPVLADAAVQRCGRCGPEPGSDVEFQRPSASTGCDKRGNQHGTHHSYHPGTSG